MNTKRTKKGPAKARTITPTRTAASLWRDNAYAVIPLVVAVITLVLAHLSATVLPTLGDAMGYLRAAQRLVAEGYYSFDGNWQSEPSAVQTPGYPLFLAALFALVPRGADIDAWARSAHPVVMIAQASLMLAMVWFITQSGKILGGRRLGLAAGVLAALYLSYGWSTLVLQSETLGALIVAVLIWFTLRLSAADRALSWRDTAILGALAACVAMVRPALSLWTLVPLAYLSLRDRPGARATALRVAGFAIAGVLVMAPWWVRNAFVFGDLVLLNTNSGPTMLDSLGGREIAESERAAYIYAQSRGADPDSAVAWSRVRRYLTESPGEFLASRNARAWFVLRLPWNSARDVYWEQVNRPVQQRLDYEGFSPNASRLLARLDEWNTRYHGFLLIAAVIGLIFARKEPRLWLMASLTPYALLVHYFTMFNDRYMMPVMSATILLAAAGLTGIFLTVRRRLRS